MAAREMTVHIRKMGNSDVEKVYEIEKESFSTPWSKKSLRAEIENNRLANYFVCETRGEAREVVGYFGIWVVLDEGHINNIAIAKAHRSLGYGDVLMGYIEEFAKERRLAALTLEVRRSNTVAINLYKKYKFVQMGIRKNYYQKENEDALILWRYLEEDVHG